MNMFIMDRRRLKRELRKNSGVLIKDRQDSIISVGFYESKWDSMEPGVNINPDVIKLIDSLYFITFFGDRIDHDAKALIIGFSFTDEAICHYMNYSVFVKFKDASSMTKFKLKYT